MVDAWNSSGLVSFFLIENCILRGSQVLSLEQPSVPEIASQLRTILLYFNLISRYANKH